MSVVIGNLLAASNDHFNLQSGVAEGRGHILSAYLILVETQKKETIKPTIVQLFKSISKFQIDQC